MWRFGRPLSSVAAQLDRATQLLRMHITWMTADSGNGEDLTLPVPTTQIAEVEALLYAPGGLGA